ncbi:galactose oxidase-like domain-containing protein [Lichenibacterium ramalinae]|uniref:DUF1929 domain-containing protein n=1 Tax=Lichenibacterium ramalinae TaxID=2316527 RepID=A0A4Q2REZ2_9HYPH|nr:galactose oxidase-like domain-containing protein [Lichenibacterium ramalinae]RYB04083.1 DUF1929 domain-containing protein [Lichenibacterium ramalinae]
MTPTNVLRRPSGARHRSPLRARLLRATISTTLLAGCGAQARAAVFPVAPTPAQDPLVMNLTIPADAAVHGMWSGVLPWSLVAIHTALLPNGTVASYGSPTGSAVQDGRTFDLWDPLRIVGNSPVHTTLAGVAAVDSFCSTSAELPNGNLLVSGGIVSPSGATDDHGSVLLNDTGTAVTQAGATLAQDRYYASMVTLGSGLPIILGGNIPYSYGYSDPDGYMASGFMGSMTPEVYDPASGWRSLFGANSRLAFGPDYSRYWYPRAWLAPNGKLFGISSEQMWSLDPTGNGSVTSLGGFKTAMKFDAGISAGTAPNVGPTSTAVMYDIGKILQVGGNGRYNGDKTVSSNLATTIDINGGSPAVRDVAPMRYGRQWATATVLPTGQVAVTGGSTFADNDGASAVLAAETWDPATAKWTVGASGAVYRGYHSTATLLQDGAVLVAGGGVPGPVDNLNAEIFYPSYFFKSVAGRAVLATRPQIVSLSTSQVAHGQTLGVEVNTASGIGKVALVRLSATTHSFNTGQRYVNLSFTVAGNVLSLAVPSSPNTAPPGYYQVVVVDSNGVPSPGVIVALGAGMAPPTTRMVPANIAVPLAGEGWSTCAAEGGTCTAAGTQAVAFGSGTQWITQPVSGTVACTVAAFGADPMFGTAKSCRIQSGQAVAGGTTPAPSGGSGTAGTTGGGSGTAGGGSGGTAAPTAVTIGSGGVKIAAAPDGTTATVNTSNNIWVSNLGSGWQMLPGTFKDVAVLGANRFYAIGLDDNVYRYAGGAWSQVGTYANAISAASDGTIAIVNDQNGTIYLKTTDDAGWNWQAVPGTAAKRVALVKSGSIYYVGTDGNVWRTDGRTAPVQVGNAASAIAASADGSVTVVGSGADQVGALWRKPTDDGQWNWSQVPGTAVQVAAPDRTMLVTVSASGDIVRR